MSKEKQPAPASPDANQGGGQDEQWKPTSSEGQDKFLLAVARIKTLVNTGQTEAVRKEFDQLKKDFPEIAGPDFLNPGEILCNAA